MKKQQTISNVTIQYKDDEYSKHRFIDFLINHLLESTNIEEVPCNERKEHT